MIPTEATGKYSIHEMIAWLITILFMVWGFKYYMRLIAIALLELYDHFTHQ